MNKESLKSTTDHLHEASSNAQKDVTENRSKTENTILKYNCKKTKKNEEARGSMDKTRMAKAIKGLQDRVGRKLGSRQRDMGLARQLAHKEAKIRKLI